MIAPGSAALEGAVARIVFVTDTASDLDAAVAQAHGIRVVPLAVTFGADTYRAGVDLSTADFWQRMTAADAPFPKTAATSPGDFKAIYDGAFAEGAEAIISVHVSGNLSGAIKSAELARGLLPDREIHVVDSQGASMAEAILCFLGQEMAAAGASAADIAASLTQRANDLRMVVSLETLEYLKKGGRISGRAAAIGTLLSVKPIIAVEHGVVEVADKPRTRSKSRERCIELIVERPIERIAILHTMAPDVDAFRDEVTRRCGLDPNEVLVTIVGPSVGPHLGPGCVGAAVLYRAS
jgi:DegV family protein with EDD domain